METSSDFCRDAGICEEEPAGDKATESVVDQPDVKQESPDSELSPPESPQPIDTEVELPSGNEASVQPEQPNFPEVPIEESPVNETTDPPTNQAPELNEQPTDPPDETNDFP